MHTFQTRYNNKLAKVVLYEGIEPAEFLDVISINFKIKGQIVGFRDKKGLILFPNYISKHPEAVKGDGVFDVVVKDEPVPSELHRSNLTGTTDNPPSNLLPEGSTRAQRAEISSVSSSFQGGPVSLASAALSVPQPVRGAAPFQDQDPNRRQEIKEFDSQQYLIQLLLELNLPSDVKNESIKLAEAGDPVIKGSFIQYLANRDHHSFFTKIKDRIQALRQRPATTERHKAFQERQQRRDEEVERARLHSTMNIEGRQDTSKAYQYRMATSTKAASSRRAVPGPQSASFSDFSNLPWAQGHGPSGSERPVTRGGPRQGGGLSHSNSQLLNGATTRRCTSMQERFISIIHDLEMRSLLDEQTVSLVITLILEQNHEMYCVLNSFLSNNIDHFELSFRLQRMVERLSTYIERPTSPIPRGKHSLLQFLSVLTQNTLRDRDDQSLLNKLVQDENEFVLSALDVFESDRDTQNLIDSLKIIIKKYKNMGLGQHSLMASSFYNSQVITRHVPNIFHSSEGADSEQVDFPRTRNHLQRKPAISEHARYARPQTSQDPRPIRARQSTYDPYVDTVAQRQPYNVHRVHPYPNGSSSESEQPPNRYHLAHTIHDNFQLGESQRGTVFSDIVEPKSERQAEIVIQNEMRLEKKDTLSLEQAVTLGRPEEQIRQTEEDIVLEEPRQAIEAILDSSGSRSTENKVDEAIMEKLQEKLSPHLYGILQELVRTGEPSVQHCIGLHQIVNNEEDLVVNIQKLCKVFLTKVLVEKFGETGGPELVEQLARGNYGEICEEFATSGALEPFVTALLAASKRASRRAERAETAASQNSTSTTTTPAEGMVESLKFLNERQTNVFKQKLTKKDPELRAILLQFHHNFDIERLKDKLLLAIGLVPSAPTPRRATPAAQAQVQAEARASANEIFISPESNEERDFERLLDSMISAKQIEASLRSEIIEEFREKNEILMGALELYEMIGEKEELLDSLKIVIEKVKLKRGRRPRLGLLQPAQGTKPLPPAPAPAPAPASASTAKHARQADQDEERKQRKYSYGLDLDDTPKSIQDDEKKRFKQHQHQIVAKLAKDGYFGFVQAIKIHELVDQDNKNIIFAFEVFAVNKNKDDFAETLDLIRQVIYKTSSGSESEDSGRRRSPQSSAQRGDFGAGSDGAGDDEDETVKTILNKMSDHFHLGAEEKQKISILFENKNETLMGALSMYQVEQDLEELRDTIQHLLK